MSVASLPVPSAARRSPPFHVPPRTTTRDGRTRLVGAEIEFAGLSVDEASGLVQRLYGGEVHATHRFTTEVQHTSLGDFRVETDAMALKNQRYKAFLDKLHAGEAITSVVEDVIEAVASRWVPTEIVTAPIALEKLARTEALRWGLLGEEAEGTRKSLLYGFAFQLNPEVPGLDAGTLCRYLRSFLALYDWLAAVIDVDVTRAYSPFVDAFPGAYRRKVLAPDYAPDLDTLIADYLEHNPTRNRPLDMLPVFATLRPELVLATAKEHDQVKPRPTFHYRLPNCLVDDPSWSFALEWNRWVEVERLAEDAPRLDAASAELLALPDLDSKPPPEEAIARASRFGIVAP